MPSADKGMLTLDGYLSNTDYLNIALDWNLLLILFQFQSPGEKIASD